MLCAWQVNRIVRKVQEAVCHYDATLRQFIVDDKGTVAIVVFGLPPIFHEVNVILYSSGSESWNTRRNTKSQRFKKQNLEYSNA